MTPTGIGQEIHAAILDHPGAVLAPSDWIEQSVNAYKFGVDRHG
jgi:hypothetical protein